MLKTFFQEFKTNISSISLPEKFTFPFYYEPHELSILAAKDLQNYLEIFNWLKGLGFPEKFQQYHDLASQPSYSGETLYSDVSLIINASPKTSNYELTFIDAFPISLSAINFNTVDSSVNYVDADVQFKYTYFTITNI